MRPAADLARELVVARVVSGSVLMSDDMTIRAEVCERDSRDTVRVEAEVAASAAAAIRQHLGRD